MAKRTSQRYEAQTWLESNSNPAAFASNRFRNKRAAAKFFEQLYAAGAVQVYVTEVLDEDWRIKLEGGPYADSLVIELPDDPARRRAVFKIANNEARHAGFAPEADSGQRELFLWWD